MAYNREMTSSALKATPAHELIRLALRKPNADALNAWLDLSLNTPGMTSDGTTDLLWGLRHSLGSNKAFLMELLRRAPDDAWLKDEQGHDALDMALLGHQTELIEALLKLPNLPSPENLLARSWPDPDAGLIHPTIANGMARKGWTSTLDAWLVTLGDRSPAIWSDVNSSSASVLVKHKIVCPQGIEKDWGLRLKRKTLSADCMKSLLPLIKASGAPSSPQADLHLAAYLQTLSKWDGNPATHFEAIPHPDLASVIRQGMDGKKGSWSLLGASISDALESMVSGQGIAADRLPDFLPDLMGSAPSQPLAAGLPAAPVLALLSYGACERGHSKIETVPIHVLTKWAAAPLDQLLTQAMETCRLLSSSPLGSINRWRLLSATWQGVIRHWTGEWVEAKSNKTVLPHAAAMDAVVTELLNDPSLSKSLWREKDESVWGVYRPDERDFVLQPNFFAWLQDQPDHWSLLIKQAASSLPPQTINNALNAWCAQGDRPSHIDIEDEGVLEYLSSNVPDLLSLVRSERSKRLPVSENSSRRARPRA